MRVKTDGDGEFWTLSPPQLHFEILWIRENQWQDTMPAKPKGHWECTWLQAKNMESAVTLVMQGLIHSQQLHQHPIQYRQGSTLHKIPQRIRSSATLNPQSRCTDSGTFLAMVKGWSTVADQTEWNLRCFSWILNCTSWRFMGHCARCDVCSILQYRGSNKTSFLY